MHEDHRPEGAGAGGPVATGPVVTGRDIVLPARDRSQQYGSGRGVLAITGVAAHDDSGEEQRQEQRGRVQ